MEDNLFIKYLSKSPKQQEKPQKEAGPVITISREYGCFAWKVGERLIELINSRAKLSNSSWTLITKEILDKAAQELKTRPDKISDFLEGKQTGFFEDLFSSFIKSYYVSDAQILKKIKEVIYDIAYAGNAVIVGRASNIIARDIKKSLHIKIIAPFDYRVNQIAEFYQLSKADAFEYVVKNEEKRIAFLKNFLGDKTEYDFYDLVVNHAKFSEEEIAKLIFDIAIDKNVI